MSPVTVALIFLLLDTASAAASIRKVEFSYTGCFVDNAGGARDLDGLIGVSGLTGNNVAPAVGYVYSSGAMTHQLCSSKCSLGGFKYFGLQYASQCFCGNSYGSQGAAGSPNECDMACTGNSSQVCGGSDRLSVFVQTYLGINVFTATAAASMMFHASYAQPRYQTVSVSSLIECSSQCRAGCQAVIFSQQQGLCYLLRFAAVPSDLAGFTGVLLARC